MKQYHLTLFDRFKGILWAVLWFMLDQGVVALILGGIDLEGSAPNGAKMLQVFGILLVCLLSWLAIKFYRKHPFVSENLPFKRDDLLKSVGYYFVLIFVTGIISYIMSSQGIENTENQQLLESFISDQTSTLGLISYGFVIVILAPFIEELVFRGIFTSRVLPEFPWLAGIISSILFALMHIPTDIWSFLLYFSMSLILHVSYLRRGQLKDSIALHLINNGVSYLLMILMLKGIIQG